MKILIINQHTLNFGDDIAAISLIENLLEYKNLETIDIIYNGKGKLNYENIKVIHNNSITLKKIGYLNLIKYFLFHKISNRTLKDLVNKIKIADYIFVSPGGANIGIYKDYRYLLRLLIVIKEKKKPIFYLNTIGKSNDLIFNILSKIVLKNSIIYVREKKSYNYIKKLNLSSKLGVDAAFSYKDKKIKTKEKIISFIPSSLDWHPNFNKNYNKIIFNEIIPAICSFSKKNNIPIQLLPHLQKESEIDFYLEVIECFRKNNIDIIFRKDIDSAIKYNEAIKNSEFVIGMRYHSIVLSIKNCVPFICIAYENKMYEVCNYSNMNDYCIKLYDKDYSLFKLNQKLNIMYNNEKKIIKALEDINNKLIINSKLPLEQIKIID